MYVCMYVCMNNNGAQVALQTEMGQLLDMTTESPEGKLDFSRFTMKVLEIHDAMHA